MLAALLDERQVPYLMIPAHGYTRVAALITDMAATRQSTVLAHTLTAEPFHLDRILDAIANHAESSWGLVCAGSVPPGLPVETHARVLDRAHQFNLVTMLDSSGKGLRLGVRSTPHILKINTAELAQLDPKIQTLQHTPPPGAGHQEDKLDLQPLSQQLFSYLGTWAHQSIVITMGKRGALAVTGEGSWFAPALQVPFVSPAGAGDALSAGLMLARSRGQSWRDALGMGIAAAAATVMNPSTCDCDPGQVAKLLPKVEIQPI
jgi:fructose-1-phosphate kinase PfkB-like protein